MKRNPSQDVQLRNTATLDSPGAHVIVLVLVFLAAVVEGDEVSDAGELCPQRPRLPAEIVHALAVAVDDALEAVTVASCYLAKSPTSGPHGLLRRSI